jgi:hypothetical protein
MTNKPKMVAELVASTGKVLSSKQLRDIGYTKGSSRNPKQVVRQKRVQSELQKQLKKQGITYKAAIEPIPDALKATKTIVIGKGEYQIVDQIPDHAVRLGASDRALKLLELANLESLTPSKANSTASGDNPTKIADAITSGNIEELQRIIFKKQDNSN